MGNWAGSTRYFVAGTIGGRTSCVGNGIIADGEHGVQEEAVHDTKAHMADINITNVIEYVQENRKEKYNTGFKIGIGCLVVSLVLFLLYLREAYRFQGNYFGTMIRMTAISGIYFAGEMVLERCYLEKLEERRRRAEKGSTGGALYLLCSYAYESDVSGMIKRNQWIPAAVHNENRRCFSVGLQMNHGIGRINIFRVIMK